MLPKPSQGMDAFWKALDFSWDMSYRVTKINSFVNCTYAYSLVTVALYDYKKIQYEIIS